MRYFAMMLFVVSGVCVADALYTFTPGTPANASQVNHNFEFLADDLQALTTQVNAGIQGYETIKETFNSTAQTSGPAPVFTAACSAGKRVLGGGFSGQTLGVAGGNGGVPVVIALASQPNNQGNGWEVQVFNNTNANQQITVTAICGTAP